MYYFRNDDPSTDAVVEAVISGDTSVKESKNSQKRSPTACANTGHQDIDKLPKNDILPDAAMTVTRNTNFKSNKIVRSWGD